MGAAFGWSFLAASTLILGGAIALRWDISERVLGLVMAFGSGVLISALAFELVEEAYNKAGGRGVSACSQAPRSSTPATC
jgi:ZIP family zinc transporter